MPICVFVHALKELTYSFALRVAASYECGFSRHPLSRTTINEVLTTDWYDHDPDKPWEFRYGPAKRFLTAEIVAERENWVQRLFREKLAAHWYHRHAVLWMDICSKVIPGSPQKAFERSSHPLGRLAGTMFHEGRFERTGPDSEPSPATL